MASHLVLDVAHDGSVEVGDVSAALSGLDVSQTSPVDADGSTFGCLPGDGSIEVRNRGHDGRWTKKSQEAVLGALEAIEGVTDIEIVEGGYEPRDDDEEEDGDGDERDGDDEAEDGDDADADEGAGDD